MANWLSRVFGGKVQANVPTPPTDLPEPPPTRPRRFAPDRTRLFDLDQTHRLVTLLDQPADARDRTWREDFHVAAWYASLELPSTEPFQGPDGFWYLRLDVPNAGAFDSQSLGNLAQGCVETGVGAAIFASPDTPPDQAAYVFSMGALHGLLRFDDIDGDPTDAGDIDAASDTFDSVREGDRQRLTVRRQHQVLIGAPSRDYLPPSTARPLHRHLVEGWGMADPGVALMVDPKMTPSRTIVIGRKRNAFAPDAAVDEIVRMLLWYFPPKQIIALMPEEWADDQLTPLADYLA